MSCERFRNINSLARAPEMGASRLQQSLCQKTSVLNRRTLCCDLLAKIDNNAEFLFKVVSGDDKRIFEHDP